MNLPLAIFLVTSSLLCLSCNSSVPLVASSPPSAIHPGHVEIEARTVWNDTGIRLEQGRSYRFEVRGQWTDWFMKCDAAGPVNPCMRSLMSPMKRSLRFPPSKDPRADFFSLVGTIGRGEPLQHPFLIRDGLSLRAPASGTLHAFANDTPGFYGNNRGNLALRVIAE